MNKDTATKLTRIAWLEKRIAEVKKEVKYGQITKLGMPDRLGYLHDLNVELAKAKDNICPTCHGDGVVYDH